MSTKLSIKRITDLYQHCVKLKFNILHHSTVNVTMYTMSVKRTTSQKTVFKGEQQWTVSRVVDFRRTAYF